MIGHTWYLLHHACCDPICVIYNSVTWSQSQVSTLQRTYHMTLVSWENGNPGSMHIPRFATPLIVSFWSCRPTRVEPQLNATFSLRRLDSICERHSGSNWLTTKCPDGRKVVDTRLSPQRKVWSTVAYETRSDTYSNWDCIGSRPDSPPCAIVWYRD